MDNLTGWILTILFVILVVKDQNIETKLNTSSFYNRINMIYKLDTGKNNNSIRFHIFRFLFPKAANKGIR